MKRHNILHLAGVLAAMIGGAVLVYALNIGQIKPIKDVQWFDDIELCLEDDCSDRTSQSLPFHTKRAFEYHLEQRIFQFPIEAVEREDRTALYFPKLSDKLTVYANHIKVYESAENERLWNTPLLVPIYWADDWPHKIMVRLVLSGPSSEALDLHPFYWGAMDILQSHHQIRYFISVELARFSTGLMIIFTATLFIIWRFKPEDQSYFSLALVGLSSLPFLLHFAYGTQFGSYKIWSIIWTTTPIIYTLFATRFVYRFLGLERFWPEYMQMGAMVLLYGILVFMPEGLSFHIAVWGNVAITVPATIVGLYFFWYYRHKTRMIDLIIFYMCMSMAGSLGTYELYLLLSEAPSRSMHLFHIMPLVMSLVFIWLLLSRLTVSLTQYEALTLSLNTKIAAKTAELEANFAELMEVRKKEAIFNERNRIMLDLHDGIGGQLVNTLAYMENKAVGDDTLRLALEDALRDLALMLDSLESDDGITTLLGMMRTRLETLLEQHGLVFDWQIHDEPVLKNPSPSNNLHLTRIVQEAITNVIKHADASVITISTDSRSVMIIDDGKGFDPASIEPGRHGIVGMKRRAQQIDADLQIKPSEHGTHVRIVLNLDGS